MGNGLLNWLAVTRLTRLINEKFGTPKLEFSRAKGDEAIAKDEIQHDRPVILNIPGHFLVGYGVSTDNSKTYIQDPYYNYTNFGQENQKLLSLRLFRPSFTDLSYILVTHPPEVHIALKDSAGKLVDGVEDAFEQVVDRTDSSQHTPTLIETLLPKPNDGTYSLEIQRNSPGPYTFSLLSYEKTAEVMQQDFSGFVSNVPAMFQLKYQKIGPSSITQQITFSQIRSDLKNLKDIGHIRSSLTYLRLDDLARYGEAAPLSRQRRYAALLLGQILASSSSISAEGSTFLTQEVTTLKNSLI